MTSNFDDAKTFEFSVENSKYSEKKRLSFINKFPESELLSMPIEKYADVNSKNTFCYWLEFKGILQGIGGGNASKFGIYRSQHDKQYYNGTQKNKKLLDGEELESAFTDLKRKIVECLKLVDNDDYQAISSMNYPFWDMVLIKIICIYRPNKFVNISKIEVLKDCAKALGIENTDISPFELNRLCFLKLQNKPEFEAWDTEKITTYIWTKFNKSLETQTNNLLKNYKKIIQANQLKDELYKWQLVQEFKNRPNLEALDFSSEIKSINFSNLVFHNFNTVKRNLAVEKSNEYKEILTVLFDEERSLDERIEYFVDQTAKLYKELGETLQTHHDERTASVFLTFHKPEKYTFYKDSYYRKYCEYLGLKPAKKGFKYPHYLELVGDLVENFISKDVELLNMVKGFLPENSYQDENHLILAQDILYQTFNKSDINYWIFQCNPNEFDFQSAIGNDAIDNWTVNSHKDKIKSGDKVILWLTGKESGCYALAEVTSEPEFIETATDDKYWKTEPNSRFVAGIHITHNLVDKPILRETIKKTIGFENFKGGNQGTNFSATKTEYDFLLGLIEHSTYENMAKKVNAQFFPLNQILYGPPGTGKTYNSIKQAVEIIDGKQKDFDCKLRFDELRQKGQIEFVTFHQNYSYEDFVVGIFPDVSAGVLRFDKREGIFRKLVEKAKQNWLLANNSGNNPLDFYSVFNKFFTKLFEEEVNEIEIPMRSKGHKFKITLIDIENGRIKFTKQSGGTGHDLLIRNVEAIYKDELNYGLDGLGVYYYPLNDVLKAFAATIQPQTRNEELKNFVLIIDEINRANISRVFGELITLLEEDKRLGAENELKVTLPNGEKDFGIPPNLYIIGTMNTADKSIALIDIALRRRFEFVGYYPDYEVVREKRGDEIADFLDSLNQAIYDKKQKSADYLIGHAYFLKDEPIEKTLETRVIPLLMEYFSNKTDLVSQLFTETNYIVNYDSTLFKWQISSK